MAIEIPRQESVLPPDSTGSPTIGAKPVNAEAVVGPIRRRFRGSQIIWYVLGFIEIILALRFFLLFIGANVSAGFTQFIYTISGPVANPFMNVVGSARIERSVFDWSILLAMAIYALVAWGAIKLLVMSKPVSDGEAHDKLDSQ